MPLVFDAEPFFVQHIQYSAVQYAILCAFKIPLNKKQKTNIINQNSHEIYLLRTHWTHIV